MRVFKNREEAARLLAGRLQHIRSEHPLVMAVPRGAVPMGRILAEALGGELDLVLVHKLGAPGNPEYAIGAVSESGEVTLRETADRMSLPPGWVEREVLEKLGALHERRRLYTPQHSAVDPAGRVVVLVDDGVATGATLLAAVDVVRARKPKHLVVAVAVAHPDSLALLQDKADEVVCLESPPFFFAVSEFFLRFPQVSDQEVVRDLREAREAHDRPQPVFS